MKTRAKNHDISHAATPKADRQATASTILQSYQDKTAQRQTAAEEELLQGKLTVAQKQALEEEELLQGKFENTAQREASQVPVTGGGGLPQNLRSGIENLSGYSMDDVNVHYNSSKPATLQAHAYAQGTDIHIAPGQEKHLPHEAWHVVQQKQGRVKPTMQLQGINVNDNQGLEKEADLMGSTTIENRASSINWIINSKLSNSPQIAQLNKKNHKGKGPKSKRPTGPPQGSRLLPSSEIESESDEIVYSTMAKENDSDSKGVFEEEYDTPKLFWRGDDRGPDQVFETGFTTKNERDGITRPGANQIIWREGGATDDILPASAVCLAKDIRGSAFFPLTGEDEFYMYAVAKTNVVNTFKAQQVAEQKETGKSDFKREERYRYDPEYEDSEKASAVWQFQEYAAHRVKPTEMLTCYKVKRRTLVPPQNGENVAIAGIQFRLEHLEDAPIHALGKHQKTLKKQLYKLQSDAKNIAEHYMDYYPDENKFLSYMGIVTPFRESDLPQNLGEAKEKMKRVQPIVVED